MIKPGLGCRPGPASVPGRRLLSSWFPTHRHAAGSLPPGSPMSDVTRILSAVEQGDPHAAEELLPLVYEELRKLAAQKMAREAPGQTLQTTALVHEAYLRLVGHSDSP